MIPVEISIAENVTAALTELERRGTDLTDPMLEIAGYLREQIEVRFATETAPGGVPWKKSKRAEKTGGQTLTDKADLRRSMRTNSGRDFAEAGPEASGGAARYAAIHQLGFDGLVAVPFHKRTITSLFGKPLESPREVWVEGQFRHMRMPAREYLGFTTEDGEEVLQILLPWLGEPLAGAVQ